LRQHSGEGARLRDERDAIAAREGDGPAGVVVVLVGQQDGRDLLRRDASLPQTPQQRAQRKARVEQHSSRAGLRDERVPAAAAAQ